MEYNNSGSDELYTCQFCNGLGTVKFRQCPNCAGAGVARLLVGRLYYWQYSILEPWVYLARIKRFLEWLIDVALLIFGGYGFWAAGYYLWSSAAGAVESLDILNLYYDHHSLLLVFWLSVAGDIFFFYRASERKAAKQRIKPLTPGGLTSEDIEVRNLDIRHIKSVDRIDIFSGFSLAALKSIEDAVLLARKYKQGEVTPAHLLMSVLNNREVLALFGRLELPLADFREKLNHQLQISAEPKYSPLFGRDLRKALIAAYKSAALLKEEQVRPVHLLMPLLAHDKMLHEIFYAYAVEEKDVANTVAWFALRSGLVRYFQRFHDAVRLKPAGHMDRAYTAQATPLLNAFSRDLTQLARQMRLAYCVGRDPEIEEIFSQFKSGKNGVMLVGEVGVGKKTIAGGLAQLMVTEAVPEFLEDMRLVEIDVSRLLSGINASAAQERLQRILAEVATSGNVVIYIDNIETISGISAGGNESLDLADVLISFLEQNNIYCLASVNRESYAKVIEHRPLGYCFAKVEIDEPRDDRAIRILESKIPLLENKYKVFFTYGALEETVRLSDKFMHEQFLPAKGIELLESLAAGARGGKRQSAIITANSVAELVSKKTGVPLTQVDGLEGKELLNLEERIHQHMINQVEAVDAVSAALRRARAQLSENKRPIASFLFLGPTGVGKTELAKAIAQVYFSNQRYMIRLDMSEYQTQSMLTKMIGDAQGNKGYLTEAVRRNPFSLILLDEFEKAHPDILNLFLQVMDDGRLTDGSGRTVDFTSSIIIATSNAGAGFIQERIRAGSSIDEIRPILINEHLVKIMKPELINRFDGVIVFKPLKEPEVIEIARLLLRKIGDNLAEKGIHLEVAETGLKILAHAGFDPQFGARPLRRALQDLVENQIANRILSGELKRRDTIVIDEEGHLQVVKASEL